MTAVDWMRRHPEFKHGRIRIAFTTDEEIGRGTQHFDVEAFGAKYAYTLDGGDLGEIEDETFCADAAKVIVEGADVHPGYAKGKMINAVRVASRIIDKLPTTNLPETTEGRESYLHPYDVKGDVSRVEIKCLIRAFTNEELAERAADLRRAAAEVHSEFPGSKVSVEIQEQYRNMGFEIANHPVVMDLAIEAAKRMGIEPIRKAIRGGTDGARLTYMGLPTPNLWAGGQNFHSIKEWVSLDWMVKSVEFTLQLLGLWVEHTARTAR